MTTRTREQILEQLLDPRTAPSPQSETLGWDELGKVAEGLAFAQRPIRASAHPIIKQHDLGPRGAFILSLISGGVCFPLELAKALHVGRSLITAELARLTDAGLVIATQGAKDKRRVKLALTPAGEQACDQVRQSMNRIIQRNLSAYSNDEIRLFSRMLRDVRKLESEEQDAGC